MRALRVYAEIRGASCVSVRRPNARLHAPVEAHRQIPLGALVEQLRQRQLEVFRPARTRRQ